MLLSIAPSKIRVLAEHGSGSNKATMKRHINIICINFF